MIYQHDDVEFGGRGIRGYSSESPQLSLAVIQWLKEVTEGSAGARGLPGLIGSVLSSER